jgi:hypothetical protein
VMCISVGWGGLRSAPPQTAPHYVHGAIEGGVDEKDTIKEYKMKVNENANGLKSIFPI